MVLSLDQMAYGEYHAQEGGRRRRPLKTGIHEPPLRLICRQEQPHLEEPTNGCLTLIVAPHLLLPGLNGWKGNITLPVGPLALYSVDDGTTNTHCTS